MNKLIITPYRISAGLSVFLCVTLLRCHAAGSVEKMQRLTLQDEVRSAASIVIAEMKCDPWPFGLMERREYIVSNGSLDVFFTVPDCPQTASNYVVALMDQRAKPVVATNPALREAVDAAIYKYHVGWSQEYSISETLAGIHRERGVFQWFDTYANRDVPPVVQKGKTYLLFLQPDIVGKMRLGGDPYDLSDMRNEHLVCLDQASGGYIEQVLTGSNLVVLVRRLVQRESWVGDGGVTIPTKAAPEGHGVRPKAPTKTGRE